MCYDHRESIDFRGIPADSRGVAGTMDDIGCKSKVFYGLRSRIRQSPRSSKLYWITKAYHDPNVGAN